MFPASRCIQNQLQRLPKLQPNPLLNLPDRLAQSISTASRRQIADATQATPFPTVSVVTTVSGVSGQGQSQLPDRTRQVVLDMLLRIHQAGAYANLLSEGIEEAASLPSGRSKADLTEMRRATHLSSMVTRWRLQLDWLVEHFAARPLHRLEDSVLQILRLGLFEIVHRQCPAHVVNEFVGLAKKQVRKGHAQAVGGIVNAVLRSAVRAREAGKLPQALAGAPDTLGRPAMTVVRAVSVRHSHPEWVVARWLPRLGPEKLEALLIANNRLPQYAVRAAGGAAGLQQELLQEGIFTQPSSLLPDDFLVVDGVQQLLQRGYLAAGKCQVQDEAAGLVVMALDPQPGEHILDCCAAPGGKALFAASRMAGQGSLLALDISASRLGLLQTSARQQHLDSLISTHAISLQSFVADPESGSRVPARGFDKVLLDAPCSGTGVLGKRADLRWRRTGKDLQELIALQADLLQAASGLVNPGGILVYSTCSLEPEENEQQVTAFLQRHAEFTVQSIGTVNANVLTEDGFLLTLPHVHGTDGAFAARLQRQL